GEREGDPVLLSLLGGEGLLDAAEAGRAVQVDAAVAIRGLPVRADVINLAARHDPALDISSTHIERLVLTGIGTLFEAAVDEQVDGLGVRFSLLPEKTRTNRGTRNYDGGQQPILPHREAPCWLGKSPALHLNGGGRVSQGETLEGSKFNPPARIQRRP